MSRIKNFLKHPESLIIKIGKRTRLIPDKLFLKAYYKRVFGKKLDLNHPVTYNEKLQWLKLNDHKTIYSTMVDKYAVKQYVSKIIGSQYIIPTIGVFDRFEDINIDKLPDQFVIKCNHDSGGVIICKDKALFDFSKAKKTIEKKLRHNFFLNGREWPYKNVKPRIIIEKYLEDKESGELSDYKFYTFNGEPKLMMLITDRQKKATKANYFDMDFKPLDFLWGYAANDITSIRKPHNFELMKEFSKELSKDTIHLRVDFYEVNGQLFFGELTFFDGGGFDPFEPDSWDVLLGKYIKLPID